MALGRHGNKASVPGSQPDLDPANVREHRAASEAQHRHTHSGANRTRDTSPHSADLLGPRGSAGQKGHPGAD